MQIGELARTTSTKVETIRFYEKIGLLPEPGRTAGNYRDYGAAHLARLSFIRRARDLGFTSAPLYDASAYYRTVRNKLFDFDFGSPAKQVSTSTVGTKAQDATIIPGGFGAQ